MAQAGSRIRVMHLIHQLGAGGAENGIINLANTIDRETFDMAICSIAGHGARSTHLATDVDFFALNKKQGNDPRLPFRLRALFRSWKPDIVHTHAWGTLFEGFVGAKMARVPVLVHGEHGTIEDKPLNRFVQRNLWKWFDAVLSVSEVHRTTLSRTIGFPEDRIQVLKNGVDADVFSPMPCPNVFGLEGRFVVGTIGRLVPIKNQALLIKAVARARAECPDIALVIVGDGPLRQDLQTLASDLGLTDAITFAGQRFDMPEVYNSLDLFVLPSLSEGMSNTILEAMSCQLPVLATNVGGNPELIRHRVTGMLTESNDALQMAETISLLRSDQGLRENISRQARQAILANCSLDRMVSKYQDFYHHLAQ